MGQLSVGAAPGVPLNGSCSLNQTSTVKLLVEERVSDGLVGMLTKPLTPLKSRALPETLSRVHATPLARVPLFPFPLESEAARPEPSSKCHCATGPAEIVTGVLPDVIQSTS